MIPRSASSNVIKSQNQPWRDCARVELEARRHRRRRVIAGLRDGKYPDRSSRAAYTSIGLYRKQSSQLAWVRPMGARRREFYSCIIDRFTSAI